MLNNDLDLGLDTQLISYIIRRPDSLAQLQKTGIDADFFGEDYRPCWLFIARVKKQHGSTPSRLTMESRFPNFKYQQTRENDLSYLLAELKKRKKWWELLGVLEYAANNATSPEKAEAVIETIQSRVNTLSFGDGQEHMVDLFSREASKRITNDLQSRSKGLSVFSAIPTGLKTIDEKLGGLLPSRMVVLIARTSVGKTWLNLMFVAQALLAGKSVLLYPLEMTLEETAHRLYSLLSQTMLGNKRVFKNLDLDRGNVSATRVIRFLRTLEEKLGGKLHVADVGSLTSAYTIDRINAEVDLYRPDMFWVDYLTLLKAPSGNEKEYTAVRALSNGIKEVAMRYRCVGGCSAQVNREAMNKKAFLPRPENISFGDSIGHDANLIISLNRKDEWLYYGVVKNRHGPEFGPIRTKFFPDLGIIEESQTQIMEEDD